MNKFEVGDRVIISENIYNFTFAFLTKGEKGTVKEILEDSVIVEFDNDVDGWGNEELGIKEGHGAFIMNDRLNLLKE